MVSRRLLLFLVLPLVCGVLAFAAERRLKRNHVPRIEVPATIEVGYQTGGSKLNTTFTIRNVGEAPLEVSDVETGCGCLRLFKKTELGPLSLERETVPPGGVLQVMAQADVAGKVSQQFHSSVRFRSNDPECPRITIEVVGRIDGTVFAVPPTVLVRSLPRKGLLKRTFFIHNSGRAAPCRISRIESSDPDRVQVVAFVPKDEPIDPAHPSYGRIIGTCEVQLSPTRPADSVEGELTVYEAGRELPLLRVPVSLTVVPRISLAPSELVLPRATGEGQSFSVRCICQGPEGSTLDLAVKEAPPGLSVTIGAALTNAPNVRSILVQWHPDRDPTPASQTQRTIRLIGSTDGQEEILEVPVHCLRPE